MREDIVLQFEVTLWRDMKPRSRPTAVLLPEGVGERGYGKLFPGSSSDGEHLAVTMTYTGKLFPQWLMVSAHFTIEGIAYTDPRPGAVYLGASDIPSGMIHFLPMAPPENPLFGGMHTLTLRRI